MKKIHCICTLYYKSDGQHDKQKQTKFITNKLTSELRDRENTSAWIRGVVKRRSQQHSSAGANPQGVAMG